MTDIKWRFREKTRAEINQDPMEREFFGDEPINTRLVRESIQNSLDAGIAKVSTAPSDMANEPVRVRFSLAGIHNPLSIQQASKYLAGLGPHISALPELRNLEMDASMPFIVVEDAGTVGLQGDWEQDKDSENDRLYSNMAYLNLSHLQIRSPLNRGEASVLSLQKRFCRDRTQLPASRR